MELTSLRDAYVGAPGVSGLSVEQRKRLTIGVELVANPSIIFMDVSISPLLSCWYGSSHIMRRKPGFGKVIFRLIEKGYDLCPGEDLVLSDVVQAGQNLCFLVVTVALIAGAYLRPWCSSCRHCNENSQEHSPDGPYCGLHNPSAINRHLWGSFRRLASGASYREQHAASSLEIRLLFADMSSKYHFSNLDGFAGFWRISAPKARRQDYVCWAHWA